MTDMAPFASAFASGTSAPATATAKSPASKALPGLAASPSLSSGAPHSEHSTSRNLADALNRTLSWDLPQPPRKKDKIRQNISSLQPPTGAPLNEDGLPTPEPFKIKMVETIT
jgi:hypothetical protein